MNQALPPHLYFWRDQTGHEVDLIGEWGGKIQAMEIKWSATFQATLIKNLKYFMALCAEKAQEPASGYLIYTGTQEGCYLDVALGAVDNSLG